MEESTFTEILSKVSDTIPLAFELRLSIISKGMDKTL